MALTKLKLSEIEAGALEEEVQRTMEKLANDIKERPELLKARTLTIEVSLTPVEMKRTAARAGMGPIVFDLDWKIKDSIPGQSGMTTRGFVVNGTAMINPGDPVGENPDQGTIFDNVHEVRPAEARG